MTFRNFLAGTLLLAGALHGPLAVAQPPAVMPPISGERPVVAIPAGWVLAYAELGDNGGYMLEYLPAGENIDNWRGEYLYVGRYPYPAGSGKTDPHRPDAPSIGDTAVNGIQQQVAATCRGQGGFTQQPLQAGLYHGARISLAAGFCPQMGQAAPYGEGAAIAFIEGNDYLHQVSFHWRPASAEQRVERLSTLGAEDGAVERYQRTIRATTLCGGQHEPACSQAPGSNPPASR